MSQQIPPEMSKLLSSELEPVKLVQGQIPFPDGKRTTDNVEVRPVMDRTAEKLVMPPHPADQMLFTMGPLYWSMGISFDLIPQFLNSERGAGAVVQRYETHREFMPDVPGWNKMVEAINREQWDNLVLFLAECMFGRAGNYWTVCGEMLDVQIVKQPVKSSIAVFTPRTMLDKMVPWVDEQGAIRFTSERVREPFVPDNFTRKLSLLAQEKR